ncbi:MAG: helix-turn-helix transcriptional regulator [Blastocatellia bacterium]
MGRSSREKPQRLAEKLLRIRESLNLSQTEMITRLGLNDKLRRTDISKFELGQNEPSLLVLLEYGRVANVCLDVLANDKLDLPRTTGDMKSCKDSCG